MSAASGGASGPRSWPLDVLVVIVVPALLVAAIYLFPFIRDPGQLPFGADTYGYMWRVDLARAEGISALTPEGTGLKKSLGERPAYPVVVGLLRSASGATSLEVMWVLPAVIGAAIAIAAAGLATETDADRRRVAGLLGVGVAASAFVAQTAVGYGTNLMFDVIAVSAGVLAVRTAVEPHARGWASAGLLLGAGALFHWLFAILFGLLLLVFAGLVAAGRTVLRGVARPPAGAAVRIAAIVAIAAAFAAVAFVFAPDLPGRLPGLEGGGRGTRLRLPRFDLAVTLPAATLGAVLVLLGNVARRWSLALLVPWGGLAVVGLIGWFWLELPTRPYRFAGFALGIPILIVLGALSIADAREGRLTRTIATVVAVAAVVALAWGGTRSWWDRGSKFGPELFAQLDLLARYVDRVPGTPWVLLPYSGPPAPPLSPVRAGLPPRLYGRIVLFPAREGIPADPAGARIAIHLDAINRRAPADGTPLGPGVAVVEGPVIRVDPVPAPRAPGPVGLAVLVAVCIATVVGVGSGWAVGLTDLSPLGAITVAPAFGLGALGLVGTLASRLGAPLAAPGGIAIVAGTAAAGWGVAAAAKRGRSSPSPAGSSSSDRPGERRVGLEQREVGLE